VSPTLSNPFDVDRTPAGAPEDERVLCRADEIAEGKGRGFEFRRHDPVFVVRWQGALYAYRNFCPHQGTTLDWKPDAFFAPDGKHLMCATHAAWFDPDTGLCVGGPCLGAHLKPAAIAVDEDGMIRLEKLMG
jgi:nitrite reductase/ring-hydroxylating ferredoxin subunit